MSDIHDLKTRSRNMAAIRSENTKPELLIRKNIHKRGFRYTLHNKKLPGKPDIVLRKYNAIIFIHGCFWHKHDCYLFKWPVTHKDFWKNKIEGNEYNDKKNVMKLITEGWRIATVWGCAIKGRYKMPVDMITDILEEWLVGEKSELEITGIES